MLFTYGALFVRVRFREDGNVGIVEVDNSKFFRVEIFRVCEKFESFLHVDFLRIEFFGNCTKGVNNVVFLRCG